VCKAFLNAGQKFFDVLPEPATIGNGAI
jgi:hypothetical protein